MLEQNNFLLFIFFVAFLLILLLIIVPKKSGQFEMKLGILLDFKNYRKLI